METRAQDVLAYGRGRWDRNVPNEGVGTMFYVHTPSMFDWSGRLFPKQDFVGSNPSEGIYDTNKMYTLWGNTKSTFQLRV